MSFKSFSTLKLLLLSLASFTVQAAQSRIELINGDQLSAEVISQNEEYITVSHSLLGELKLNKNQIMAIEHADNPANHNQNTSIAKSAKELEQADQGLWGTGLLINWKRRLDLGIAGSAGKARNQQINIGFNADYDDKDTRISYRSGYFRAESEQTLSDHSFYAAINRDWLRPITPWFYFISGRVDWDEFKDWDLRLNINGGVGYEFAKTDNWFLLGRGGLGFNRTFGGVRKEFTPEGLIGIETRWKVSENQQIELTNTFYPSLRKDWEYRNLTSFDWMLDLDSDVGVALRLGLLNEYDSATERGIGKNDFKYTVSLAWKL